MSKKKISTVRNGRGGDAAYQHINLPDYKFSPVVRNPGKDAESGIPETAFCAAHLPGEDENDCPDTLLGAEPRGTVRIPAGRISNGERVFRIFTPDLSGYRYAETVLDDLGCRCGKDGPVLCGMSASLLSSWPYSFTTSKPGDDILLFMEGDEREKRRPGRMFTLWRQNRNGTCRQLPIYSSYMFQDQDDFREFIRQQSEDYLELLKRDLASTEKTISRMKANAEKLKTRISEHRPDAYAAAADIELSCIGTGRTRNIPDGYKKNSGKTA